MMAQVSAISQINDPELRNQQYDVLESMLSTNVVAPSGAALVPVAMEERHFAGFVSLVSENECLKKIGSECGNQDMIDVGTHYVEGVVATELKDWPTCQAKYASEGLLFQTWYSSFHYCSPSRGSMMTGRLPVRCV